MRLETYSSLADVASQGCHLVHRGIVDTASCCGHGEVKHELSLVQLRSAKIIVTYACVHDLD